VFVIASSGRCGTLALCQGLDAFSDHRVEHEPDQPLRDSWLAHQGLPLEGEMDRWSARLRRRAGERYGLSWRAPNLLPAVRRAAPDAPVLVIMRPVAEYVLSAHAKRVLSKNSPWDRFRLMPADPAVAAAPLAERIAWHWRTVNDYLLDFAAGDAATTVVLLDRPLEQAVDGWVAVLGASVDRERMVAMLRTRPNAAPTRAAPPGYDVATLERIGAGTWERARRLSQRRAHS